MALFLLVTCPAKSRTTVLYIVIVFTTISKLLVMRCTLRIISLKLIVGRVNGWMETLTTSRPISSYTQVADAGQRQRWLLVGQGAEPGSVNREPQSTHHPYWRWSQVYNDLHSSSKEQSSVDTPRRKAWAMKISSMATRSRRLSPLNCQGRLDV
jgi:hypothetical protein